MMVSCAQHAALGGRLRRRRGFTLVEVLVALVILLAGIVAIVQLFPVSLQANNEAVLKSKAVQLANLKVEELRRDHDRLASAIASIEGRDEPTDPKPWIEDPRLSYSYSGRSLLATNDTAGNPSDDVGVARVIVRLSEDFDPDERVLYELRFDQ